MVRDRGSLEFAEKAKQFAERQITIAKKLEDEELLRKANIYIAYYLMFVGRLEDAKQKIQQQVKPDKEKDSVNEMALAALHRVDLINTHVKKKMKKELHAL